MPFYILGYLKKNITTSTHAEHTALLLPEMLDNYVEKQISFM